MTTNETSDMDIDDNPVDTIPALNALLNVLVTEINKNSIDIETFAEKILFEDPITVRNMIMTPLPWGLLSKKMKIKYAKMWFWLKQAESLRLEMLDMKPKTHPDTVKIADKILQRLEHCSLNSLIEDVNKGLPTSVFKSLIYHPTDWTSANENQR